MPIYLKPHSKEWFEALRNFNAGQSAHSAKIVDLAGSTEVCGICGDEPATDYELVEAVIPADAVATIRLCEDCRLIREQAGESFLQWKCSSEPKIACLLHPEITRGSSRAEERNKQYQSKIAARP